MNNIEQLRKLWLSDYDSNKEEIDKRISEGIEKYRKGDCKVLITDSLGRPLKNKKVEVKQLKHDFKHGAHLFMLDCFDTEEENKKFRNLFADYFNLATVPFYWNDLEKEKGKPRFSKNSEKIYRRPAPDLCLEYCNEKGIDAKLHCLVYDKFIPDWLEKGNMSAMEKAYEKRIKEIAERYKGKLYEFEVINETLIEASWTTNSVISEKRDVVEWAFALSRKYLPDETLLINDAPDFDHVGKHDFRSPYFMQIEKCLLNGAKIDKIGMQHHIFTGATARNEDELNYFRKLPKFNNPLIMYKAFDIMAQLGLPLEITETTIPTFGEGEEAEELQAEMLRIFYSICFSHPAVDGVVYWNQVEGHCFSNEYWNENNCKGELFHKDLTEKKSAAMLRKLFKEDWHTQLTLNTDKDGYISFRGFFGKYEALCEGNRITFSLHK